MVVGVGREDACQFPLPRTPFSCLLLASGPIPAALVTCRRTGLSHCILCLQHLALSIDLVKSVPLGGKRRRVENRNGQKTRRSLCRG